MLQQADISSYARQAAGQSAAVAMIEITIMKLFPPVLCLPDDCLFHLSSNAAPVIQPGLPHRKNSSVSTSDTAAIMLGNCSCCRCVCTAACCCWCCCCCSEVLWSVFAVSSELYSSSGQGAGPGSQSRDVAAAIGHAQVNLLQQMSRRYTACYCGVTGLA